MHNDIHAVATRARNMVWLSFGLLGIVMNAWVPRIPEIKLALHLSDAQFGLALIGGPLGGLLGAQLTGRLIHTYGSRWVSMVLAVEISVGIFMLGIADSYWTLVIALFIQGIGTGGLDNAFNTQGVAVEIHLKRKYMSSFHGAWSVGMLLAVASGGVFARFITPRENIVGVAIIGLAIFIPNIYFLLPNSLDGHVGESSGEGTSAKVPLFDRKTAVLWALGIAMVGCLIPEAAISDWGGILLHRHLHIATGLDASGVAAFGFAMIVGRFTGDSLMHRFGPERVVKLGGYIGGLSLGASIAIAVPLSRVSTAAGLIVVVLGFIIAGLGIGPMVPALISATGKIPGVAPSVAIARVGIVGILSYFIGPVITGNLSRAFSLPIAMAFPCGVLILAGYLSRTLRVSETFETGK